MTSRECEALLLWRHIRRLVLHVCKLAQSRCSLRNNNREYRLTATKYWRRGVYEIRYIPNVKHRFRVFGVLFLFGTDRYNHIFQDYFIETVTQDGSIISGAALRNIDICIMSIISKLQYNNYRNKTITKPSIGGYISYLNVLINHPDCSSWDTVLQVTHKLISIPSSTTQKYIIIRSREISKQWDCKSVLSHHRPTTVILSGLLNSMR